MPLVHWWWADKSDRQTCSGLDEDLDDFETIVSGGVVQRRVAFLVDVVQLRPRVVEVQSHRLQ